MARFQQVSTHGHQFHHATFSNFEGANESMMENLNKDDDWLSRAFQR